MRAPNLDHANEHAALVSHVSDGVREVEAEEARQAGHRGPPLAASASAFHAAMHAEHVTIGRAFVIEDLPR